MSFQKDFDEFLHNQMTECIRKRCGVSEKIASDAAISVADCIQNNFAGTTLSFPSVNVAKRNALIRKEFNGRNRAEIMEKYDIKRSQFYLIIKNSGRLR